MRLLLFLLLSFPWSVLAQVKSDRMDIVHLEGGSVLKGHILEWSGDSLTIRLTNGQDLRLSTHTVVRTEQKADPGTIRIKNESKGSTYATGGLGLAINSQRVALMLDASAGYRFNPRLALGIGAAITQYGFNGEVFYPLFLEWRARWSDKALTPYTVLRGGVSPVSWNNGNSFNGQLESRDYVAPIFAQLALGWRLWQGERAHLAGEVGYIHQKADYRYTLTFFNDTQEGEVSRTFRHFSFRVSVGF